MLPRLQVYLVAVLTVFVSVDAHGASFLRGDANGDGRVSFSDAWVIYRYAELSPDGPRPSCLEALDTDDSGWVDFVDMVFLLYHLLDACEPPLPEIFAQPTCEALPAPFPIVGPDPIVVESETLPCEEYGGSGPEVDPEARLEILSAHAVGGADSLARIVIGLENSRTLSGVSGRVRGPDDLVVGGDGPLRVDRMIGPENKGWGNFDGRDMRFLLTIDRTDLAPFLPSDLRTAVELYICLSDGTLAGEYPLALEDAELVDMDTGRAIVPETVGGVLVVENDVVGDANCEPPEIDARRWGPPFPREPQTRFLVPDVHLAVGEQAEIPVSIHSTGNVRGFSMSLDFDEERVRVVDLDTSFEVPEQAFKYVAFDSNGGAAGGLGVEDGYLVAAVVLGIGQPTQLPSNVDQTVLHVLVETTAEGGVGFATALRFRDGAPGPWGATRNEAIVAARRFRSDSDIPLELVDGLIIVGDGGTRFLRGDCNEDGAVDISDGVCILNWLFLGAQAPGCIAVTNTNGDENADISDATYLLNHLFLGGPSPPRPFPGCGPLFGDVDLGIGCAQSLENCR